MKRLSIVFVLLVLASGLAGARTEVAGNATAIKTETIGRHQEEPPRKVVMGSNIYRNERVSTDSSGIAQLLFLDNSSLVVSPNSEVVIDEFVYSPENDIGSLVISLSKGLLRFVGGRISKKNSVEIQTPSATVGIRGGICSVHVDAFGETTAILGFGRMSVSTPLGVTDVRKSGFKVTVKSSRVAPSAPVRASADDLKEAIAVPDTNGHASSGAEYEALEASGLEEANSEYGSGLEYESGFPDPSGEGGSVASIADEAAQVGTDSNVEQSIGVIPYTARFLINKAPLSSQFSVEVTATELRLRLMTEETGSPSTAPVYVLPLQAPSPDDVPGSSASPDEEMYGIRRIAVEVEFPGGSDFLREGGTFTGTGYIAQDKGFFYYVLEQGPPADQNPPEQWLITVGKQDQPWEGRGQLLAYDLVPGTSSHTIPFTRFDDENMLFPEPYISPLYVQEQQDGRLGDDDAGRSAFLQYSFAVDGSGDEQNSFISVHTGRILDAGRRLSEGPHGTSPAGEYQLWELLPSGVLLSQLDILGIFEFLKTPTLDSEILNYLMAKIDGVSEEFLLSVIKNVPENILRRLDVSALVNYLQSEFGVTSGDVFSALLSFPLVDNAIAGSSLISSNARNVLQTAGLSDAEIEGILDDLASPEIRETLGTAVLEYLHTRFGVSPSGAFALLEALDLESPGVGVSTSRDELRTQLLNQFGQSLASLSDMQANNILDNLLIEAGKLLQQLKGNIDARIGRDSSEIVAVPTFTGFRRGGSRIHRDGNQEQHVFQGIISNVEDHDAVATYDGRQNLLLGPNSKSGVHGTDGSLSDIPIDTGIGLVRSGASDIPDFWNVGRLAADGQPSSTRTAKTLDVFSAGLNDGSYGEFSYRYEAFMGQGGSDFRYYYEGRDSEENKLVFHADRYSLGMDFRLVGKTTGEVLTVPFYEEYSAFIDDDTYAAVSVSNSVGDSSQEYAYILGDMGAHKQQLQHLFGMDTSVLDDSVSMAATGRFCECEYLEWGFWGGALDDSAVFHMGTWVAGLMTREIPDSLTMAEVMYKGHAIGDVARMDNGVTHRYLAAGDFVMTWDFGSRQGTASISNFDGKNARVDVYDMHRIREFTFAGGDGAFDLEGAFFDGPMEVAKYAAGNWQMSEVDYQAAGTFAAQR